MSLLHLVSERARQDKNLRSVTLEVGELSFFYQEGLKSDRSAAIVEESLGLAYRAPPSLTTARSSGSGAASCYFCEISRSIFLQRHSTKSFYAIL